MRNRIPACIGFGLMFPVRLADGINVRLTDVVAVLLACGAGAALAASSRNRPIHWAYFAIALLTVGWIGADLTFRAYLPFNASTGMIVVRWSVALPAAYYLAVLGRDKAFRKWLILGIVAGCLATTALTVSDLINFRLTGRPLFLLEANPGLLKDDYRACGILEGPNGAAIAGLFTVPFLIGAAEEFGWHRAAVLLSIPTLCIVFYATQSRGAMLASLGLLAVVVVGSLFALVEPNIHLPGNSDDDGLFGLFAARFSNETAIEGNLSGRSDTTITSLALAFEHPFGMGSTYEAPLDQATGFEATHNALTQLALMGGLPLAGIVTLMLAGSALRIFKRPCQVQHWVALYVLLVSMFESAFYNPFFSLVVLWVVAQTTMEDSGLMASGSRRIRNSDGSVVQAHNVSER
jgi:hypothetical protein